MRTATSVSGTTIRLTDERWEHIVERHAELESLADEVMHTIANPELIVEGDAGELCAVRPSSASKWMVVTYREAGNDGFVITAFTVKRQGYYLSRKQIWPQK